MKQIWSDAISIMLLIRGTTVMLCLITFYLIVLTFADERKVRPLERRLALMVLWAFGQRLLVGSLNELSPKARVWIFNHCSFLDPFVVAAVIPDFVRGVGAHYHFKWPLWGRLLRKRGIIPVVRDNREKARAAINAGEKILRVGDALIVAPEGTRSSDGELLPFKSGAFHAAVNTGADIVMIIIDNAHLAWPKSSWRIKPMTMNVEFVVIPASSIENLGDPEELKKYAHSVMEGRLKSMRGARGSLATLFRK